MRKKYFNWTKSAKKTRKFVKNLNFQQLREEMEELRATVEHTKESISRIEVSLSARLSLLERQFQHIGDNDLNVSPDEIGVKRTRETSGNQPLDIDKILKLEQLTKLYASRSCHEMKLLGLSTSGTYFIDPDGLQGSPPVQVYCDMKTGTTTIEHDLEGPREVSKCRERGCFVQRIRYNIPMRQISALAALSENCEQHIRYDCLDAPLNIGNDSLAWWTDRNDKTHIYWAGDGLQHSHGCHCRYQATCQSNCYCDDDSTNSTQDDWKVDEGHLTNKGQLPVTQINFGGLGRRKTKGENRENERKAQFQLGPLYCSGVDPGDLKDLGTSSPASCKDLWLKGYKYTGYYMVKSREEKFPKVVFCDLTQLPEEVGFQRTFGSPGNLRHFAAFDASLGHSFYDDFRYINFSRANVNIGDAFDIHDGIFHVPVTGLYLLSIHALPMHERPFQVQIHHNGKTVAAFANGNKGESMVGQSILLSAAVGDEIRLYNFGGDIYEDESTSDDFLHFVGVLLYSSDRS